MLSSIQIILPGLSTQLAGLAYNNYKPVLPAVIIIVINYLLAKSDHLSLVTNMKCLQ